jgi:hypothetical protein
MPALAASAEILAGSLTLQMVLWRFLVRERIIDRDRLVACLAERAAAWQPTATEEAMLPLSMVLAALLDEAEPPAPASLH